MSVKKDESASTNPSCAQKPTIKYDWYQTDSHVTINILVKNLKKDDINVNFEENNFAIDLPEETKFRLNLSKPIVPSKCTIRITQAKIELKLKKLNGDLWSDLEASKESECKAAPQPLSRRNWDKLIETELQDDAAQGEAALNELFQKIYSEGSDEVKKAMNKSFMESGGTVLSTNWNEIGEKKVEIKPPDGMEWKKWDEP